jgi:hypothetical protein
MILQKEDLVGDYQWGANPSTLTFNGEPSRRLFNRFNGEQVLFLINYFATQDDKFTLEDAHNMESLINNLPLEAKSEISVLNNLKGLKPHIIPGEGS